MEFTNYHYKISNINKTDPYKMLHSVIILSFVTGSKATLNAINRVAKWRLHTKGVLDTECLNTFCCAVAILQHGLWLLMLLYCQ
jgi:hypothetical protein